MRLLNASFAGFFTMTYSSATFAFHRCSIARYPRASTRVKTGAISVKTEATASIASRMLASTVVASRARRPLCLPNGFHKTPRIGACPTTSTSTRTNLFATQPFTQINSNGGDITKKRTRSIASDSLKTYRLDGKGLPGGTKVASTTNTGHSIATDIPKTMGGGDTAPQPVETLLGAWMGCTQATASFVGRQLLLERSQNQASKKDRPRRTEVLLEFDNIQATRDEKGALELPIRQTPSLPSRLQRITGTIKVSLVPATTGGSPTTIVFDQEELEVLKEQTEARCPIANMLVESGCVMEVEWTQEPDNNP